MLNMFMVFLFILLSIMNYRRKKDILLPSFIWSSVWSIYGFLFYFYSNIVHFFYPISFYTYVIYFIGAFMFSTGEILGEVFSGKKFYSKLSENKIIKRVNKYNKKENYIMVLMFFILSSLLTVFYKNIAGLSGASLLNINTFFYQVRVAELHAQGGQFSMIKNLGPLSLISGVYFYNIYKKNNEKKVLVYSIILVGLMYQLLTGGRSGAVYMILALMGVEFMREGKIKIKNFIKLGTPLVFVITFIAYYLGKGEVDNTRPFMQNINAFYKDFISYLLGGFGAFDRIVNYPGSIASNGGVNRFFIETARSLGFNVYVPSLHMEYTVIGNEFTTNVYTIYSIYYIEYGLIGTCLFLLLLGILSSIIYKMAKKGNDFFCVLYGFLVSGIVLSVFSEYFYTNLNFLIKAVIVLLVFEYIKKVQFTKYRNNL